MSIVDSKDSASLDVLSLIADPSKFSAKLNEFKAAKAAADESIALVGPAQEILSMRDQLKAELAAAQAALAQAERDAERRIAEATAQAARILAQAEADAGVAKATLESAQEQAAELRKQAAAELTLASQERETAQSMREANEQRGRYLDDLRMQTETERAGLQAQRATLRQVIENNVRALQQVQG